MATSQYVGAQVENKAQPPLGMTEGIEEMFGTEVSGEMPEASPDGQEATPSTLDWGHTSVSKPASSTGTGGMQAGSTYEESGQEADSQYEAGWTEFQETESDTEVEATVDASQAAGGQEFFQFLVPLILPLAKAVLPQLAGAAAKAGSGALRNLINRRVTRVRGRLAGRREASTEFGDESSMDETGVSAEGAAEALAQLEVVIGRDDRLRVTGTQATPWNRICHLRIVSASGDVFLGSGALIGRRSVVTAGHCVFLHNNGGWARSIEVSPGRNGESRPYGKIMATAFHSVRGWTNGAKRDFDYGFIVLPQAPSPFPGTFGVPAHSEAEVRNKRLNTAGYPGDKAQTLPGSMWRHGRRATNVSSTVLTYDIDTAGGQSGSPVWITSGNTRKMVGIHTNGAPGGNSATRINARVLANLKAWQQAAG